ncbi:CLC2D protein, partial [Chloroceryle aenea]|nr:CLC2D protein [Chloroceryle aenea]
ALLVAVQAFQPPPRACPRCPFSWIGYRGKGYHFWEADGNWASSRDRPSLISFQLFVVRYGGASEPWIGLSREDGKQPWQWVNRSRFSHPFQIHGSGSCAHLSPGRLSSSPCSTRRSWVCNKPELQ